MSKGKEKFKHDFIKFRSAKADLDDRSVFANNIATVLVEKNGSIDQSLKDWEFFDDSLHEHVRNIYELIPTEIPIMMLYDLKKCSSPSDFDLDSQEHLDQAIQYCYDWCNKYYCNND